MFKHPTGNRPRRVAVVALGPTKAEWLGACTRHQAEAFDEVWTLNTGIRSLRHDLAFVLDDMRDFSIRFPKYGKVLARASSPIITSRVYPEFPAAIAYPLELVLERVGPAGLYLNNSIPYVLAYALLADVRELVLFGVDYDFPGGAEEPGRACAEYWIGYLRASGVSIEVTAGSPLLDTRNRRRVCDRPLYGYLRQPRIVGRGEGGRYLVDFGERDELVVTDAPELTADELARGERELERGPVRVPTELELEGSRRRLERAGNCSIVLGDELEPDDDAPPGPHVAGRVKYGGTD